jgi:hypothetical protein
MSFPVKVLYESTSSLFAISAVMSCQYRPLLKKEGQLEKKREAFVLCLGGEG